MQKQRFTDAAEAVRTATVLSRMLGRAIYISVIDGQVIIHDDKNYDGIVDRIQPLEEK
jgi:chemotaxis protein CheY-P-specific phosphatase CheC